MDLNDRQMFYKMQVELIMKRKKVMRQIEDNHDEMEGKVEEAMFQNLMGANTILAILEREDAVRSKGATSRIGSLTLVPIRRAGYASNF